MRHIKSIIFQAKESLKINKIDEELIRREAERIIKKSTPNIEVLFYKNKTIGVKCFNSITANEVFLIQEKIKEELNQFLGRKLIRKIIIKI